MSYRFQGSPSILVSTVNQEVIPPTPTDWTEKFYFKSFTFFNEDDCTVRINGSSSIFVRANQGITTTSPTDEEIYSFIVNEEGVRYTWIASY